MNIYLKHWGDNTSVVGKALQLKTHISKNYCICFPPNQCESDSEQEFCCAGNKFT